MDAENEDRPIIPFTHHLVFRRVMRDPELAKGFLERILKIEIERIEYCNTEQTIDFDLDAKGVRLDLYVKDADRVFNVEMQTQDYAELGRRMSYYQAAMNSGAIERGSKHYDLPEVFVIFLCADDPFGRGCPRYDFLMTCESAEGLVLETGSHWLVLNASDYERESDEGLRDLLRYVATRKIAPDDALLSRIDEKVRVANRDKELVEMSSMLMTFEEDAVARGILRGKREGREEGRQEGREEGEERYAELAGALAKDGRIEDIERAASDKAFRQQLLQEFGLA